MIIISVTIKKLGGMVIFNKIDIHSKIELEPYFNLVDYAPCEYSFITILMWQHVYKTRYLIRDSFAVIIGEYEGETFCMAPLAKEEDREVAFEYIVELFKHHGWKFNMRAVPKSLIEKTQQRYGDSFQYIDERDYFDYVYLAEHLINLQGKKYQKKRNHIRSFLKEYEGHYQYRQLESEQFPEIIHLLDEWSRNKIEQAQFDEGIVNERLAIEQLLKNQQALDIKIGGIYIEEELKAFSIGETYHDDTAIIHVEKADSYIKGLYPMINQIFLQKEFADVKYVNREDDLGIEGLRKAKLSYYPHTLVEKYTILEK